MGSGSFSSTKYQSGVSNLRSTGRQFSRSSVAAQSGDPSQHIADILNPRKLKNGIRESCFIDGFNDATAIAVGIDGTGSMDQVPYEIQKDLPKLIEVVTEQGVSDHPNVLFSIFDDEHAIPPDAVFQMSQFEIEAEKLIEALNEGVIPHYGGGNQGEAYHLFFYALGNHTRLESFERDGVKGYAFLICDEEPYYEAGDPAKHGTSKEIAKEVFGDSIEAEVTMLESVKKVAERYHIFIIRPGHTSHGKNKAITRLWQDLLRKAGENPEHVMEIANTDAIISTMAMSIGRLSGSEEDELVDVLNAKGATGVSSAASATKAIVPIGEGGALAKSSTSVAIDTTSDKGKKPGRSRR